MVQRERETGRKTERNGRKKINIIYSLFRQVRKNNISFEDLTDALTKAAEDIDGVSMLIRSQVVKPKQMILRKSVFYKFVVDAATALTHFSTFCLLSYPSENTRKLHKETSDIKELLKHPNPQRYRLTQ